MSVKKNVISAEDKLAAALVPAEEQPYQVPENWVWCRFGSITKNYDYKRVPLSLRERLNHEKKYDYYGASGVIDKVQDYIFEDPLLLIGEDGANLLSRSTPIAFIASGRYWVNNHAHVIGLTNCLLDYLNYYVNSIDLSPYITGSAQPKLTQDHLNDIPVPLVPRLEQQRIVNHIESLFSHLDEAQEEAQAVIGSYEGRKASILHRAFTGELTAQLAQQRGTEWQSVSLKDVVAGFKYGTSEKSDYANSGLPVLRIPNIGDGIIDFSDIKYLEGDTDTGNYVRENDVLIIRSNGSRDLVGKCAIVPSTEQQYAYASFLIKIIPSAKVLPDYLVLFLNSADARAQMFAKAKSSAGIHNINSKELGAIQMPLPEAWEQQEIVGIANELIKKESAAKAAAEQAIDQIDTMKKSILARAFRGELGTNDPNDEPAIGLLKRSLEARA